MSPPNYGKGDQIQSEDTSDALTRDEVKRLQEIVGSLLFYARAVDCTMLTAVNHLASQQSKQYAAAYPKHELILQACDMILYGQSDASYLSRPDSRSVAGGIFYCGNLVK